MQAHHTFNLVLYDNIIKKQKNVEDFLKRSIELLSTAPAWIVYQWTIVNEHDEKQREWLKTLLLYQAQYHYNEILLREQSLVKDKDSSTTRELLCHIIDSCVKLGIVTSVLQVGTSLWNCIMNAVERKLPTDSLVLLIECCVRHGLDVKEMLEQRDLEGLNCILIACFSRIPFDSFKLLIGSCVQHGVDMKKMLQQENCIMIGARNELAVDSFRLLIAHFPSNESFRATLAEENYEQKRAVDYAREEIKTLLKDPDCWQKCGEWCTSNGITFRRESGKRREREWA